MRILVVDDSKATRMIVRNVLRQAGYDHAEVEEAENGKEAVAAITASPPDVVLTDWSMPEMTGIELVEHVATNAPQVPIGMVTSQGTTDACKQAKDAGAAFLLTKPLSAEKLSNALGEALA